MKNIQEMGGERETERVWHQLYLRLYFKWTTHSLHAYMYIHTLVVPLYCMHLYSNSRLQFLNHCYMCTVYVYVRTYVHVHVCVCTYMYVCVCATPQPAGPPEGDLQLRGQHPGGGQGGAGAGRRRPLRL